MKKEEPHYLIKLQAKMLLVKEAKGLNLNWFFLVFTPWQRRKPSPKKPGITA